MEKTVKNLGLTALIKSKTRMEEPELESEGELLDSEDDDDISDRESSDDDSATISINNIRRAHLAQALSRRQQINKVAKSRQVMSQRAIMNQKRKMEAVRSFHDFTKKLKQDTGITIRSLKGGGVMELDDILSCDSDDKSDTSDGLSEENFEVDPSAVAELDEADESYIDPETGDIVEPVKKNLSEKKVNEEKVEIESSDPTPKTLTIGDIINDNDLDLTKNVEIADIIEGTELSLDKNGEDILDLKEDQTGDDGEFDITEKLKEMGEISVKPVKKDSLVENTDEAPKPGETEDDKKNISANALNVRRNIRDVMDEKQLDASTLAAQRQESERLARVQEQQRIIREVQRQIAINRQTKQQQARAMSILQSGGASLLKKSASGGASGHKLNLPNTVLVKLPSGEVKKTSIKPSQLDVMRVSKSGVLPIGQKIVQKPDFKQEKKEVVEIVDSSSSGEESSSTSSDSDDCIMLSDSEVPPSPEPPDEDPQNSGLHVNDSYNVPDDQGRVVINIGHPENEEDIFLAPQIARIIKPHQVGGVRFLFDNIIESVERFSTSTGFGCILAHSMGLGKTLQIVCFCDIFLRHTSSKTVLCIMPINTLQNWVAEFNMWLPLDGANCPLAAQGEVRSRNFPIYVLNDSHKTLQARAKVVQDWSSTGGVLMIGYELYRLLSMKKDKKPRRKKKEPPVSKNDKVKTEPGKDLNEDTQGSSDNVISKLDVKMEDVDGKIKGELDEADIKKEEKKEDEPSDEDKKLLDEMYEALVKPGPDLVICDEGHRIKNSHSNISYALKQMRTKRRVVLTGYPLQNNLLEYWCMVDFVRPNYLGTKTEFSNMFERPIQNGQCIDSTPEDIRLMRYRAHVLHSLLVGFVQRRSHAVLQSTLPQKEEYVLLVRMTPLQRQLYDTFMNEVVRSKAVPNPLKAFAICCKIWNHPDVLYFFLKKRSESNAAMDLDLDLEEPGLVNAAGRKNSRSKGGAKKNKQPAKAKDKKAAASKPAATIPPNTTSSIPHFPPGSGPFPSNQYPPYGPSGFPPYPHNHGSYQPPGYHQYPPQAHNSYYPGGDSYNQNYNAGYYQQPYGNNYNQYPPNPQSGAPNYQQDQYWGNSSGYYGNSGYYNNQSYPPPGNHTPDNYQRNQDYGNSQSRPPYTGGEGQSFTSNQTGPSAYPLNPAIPTGSYPTHPGTSSAYPPNSAGPTQYPPNRANSQPSSFTPNPTAPTSYSANQNTPTIYPENQPSQGPYPSNQNVQPYSSTSSTPQPYPGTGDPSYGNSYSSEQVTAYRPANRQQDAQGSFSNNNYNPYGENNATPPYSTFDRSVYPNYNANRSESQAPSQVPAPSAVEAPAVTESYNPQVSQATPNTPFNYETPTTPAIFPEVPEENRDQPAFNDQFSNFDQNNLETKPPLGSADDQLPTWPLATAMKSTVVPPKTEEESKIEAKSESDDGEVKIEDLDTKKIIHNEIKTENKSECIKEETKPDLSQAVTGGSHDMLSNNAKVATPLDTKEEEGKKTEDNESSSEAKKESNKKKDTKERKKCEPKSKSKQKSLKQRAAKNGKDRKSSKDKKDESDTDKESEKEEKRDKEEEAALAKKHEEMTYDWATELLKDYMPGIIENSAKMEILFCILNESIKMGDRLLLFSQSLFTLNLIEDFLQKNYVPGTDMLWGRNKNYFRLDGSTSALEREKLINEFNTNSNVFLFLVSTRAGSLGINLVGANRVIVFDASWNPCHDTQAVCRVYRYGQQKPCFVYRLVMDCCLEKKIYDRQINKQGMADRVVDECNPDAVLSMKEITNLCWDNDEKEQEQKDLSAFKDKYGDPLMQKIIMEHSKTLSKEPFQHESLLVDRKEKKLSSAEKRLAQRGYELEKKAAATPKPVAGYRGARPVASVRPMQHGARWIPADVWRRQGMTAQEMTLPLDVVIPTNSAEKTNIVLKAGQRVMVLKSPKGIYMQLESGKIIAIKTSFKVGQKGNDGKDNSNAVGKKIMGPRPQVNLPGSLKNNSAITVIPKGGRPGIQKVISRPGLISQNKNLSVRPIVSGQKIQDFRGRTTQGQSRPLPIIRNKAGISQHVRTMRPINIQSKNMGIKIQCSDKETSKLEEVEKDGDGDSDLEPASGTNSNQSSIAGASKTDADELEGGHRELQDQVMDSEDESDIDNTNLPISSPDIAEEDSSREKTYIDQSEESYVKRVETKRVETKQSDSKQFELKQASLRHGKKVINPLSILKTESLKERSLTLKSDFTETEYKNVTIRRTAVPSMREETGPSQDGPSISVDLLADEKFPSEAALDVKTPPSSATSDTSGPHLAADVAELDDDIHERKSQKLKLTERPTKTSSLKNYRHQKMGPKGFGMRTSPASTSSAPTSPPAVSSDVTPAFESSLSRLERTAISISRVPKPGMTDFRQSLNNITKSYSPGASDDGDDTTPYKPGPKSRKKKPSKKRIDNFSEDSSSQSSLVNPDHLDKPAEGLMSTSGYNQPSGIPVNPGPSNRQPYPTGNMESQGSAQPPYNQHYPGYLGSGNSYTSYNPAAPFYPQQYTSGAPGYPPSYAGYTPTQQPYSNAYPQNAPFPPNQQW